MLATSMMFYMVSGILFWASDYMRTVINEPKDSVTLYFGIVSLSSPVLGAVASVPVVNYVGGYRNYKILPVCFGVGFTSACICVWMPYWDNAPAVLASIWGGLFLGGIMLPIYQGVMLAAVDDNLKHKS
jgi:MFS transporter, Spinster family, sphingosine-1-phosphate transporter